MHNKHILSPPGRAILLLALTLCLSALAMAQTSAVSTLLKQAASLESRGRIDLAVQTWQRALLADPDQVDALIGLARNAKRQGDLVEANRLLQRLRELAPGRSEITEIESIRVIAGKEDRLNEARRLAGTQQYEQAMEIYREVIGPSAPPGGFATSYYETEAATPGGWPRAVAGLRRLVDRFPDASAYKLSLGRLLTYRPETRLEGVRLLQTVSGDPESVRLARSAWRQALVWEGPSSRAVSSLESYLSTEADPELEQILSSSRTTRAAGVDDGGAAAGRGYDALNAGNLEDAEQQFQQALRVNPNNSGATAGLGFIRMKQQRFQDAERFLTRALELKPGDQVVEESLDTARFWVAFRAGEAAVDQEQFETAAAEFNKALRFQPDNIDAVRALAGVYMLQGRAAEAAPLFERVVAEDPSDNASWKALLRNIYDSDGALATLERHKRVPASTALELENDVEHLILMASVYGQTGRQAQFDVAFQKVLRMTPNEADALSPIRLQFAGLLNDMGRSLEAASEYERTVEANPENIDAWEGLLSALMKENNGRAMAALARMPRDVYEEALERPSFLFNVGLMHREAGRKDEAAAFLRSALAMGDKLSRQRKVEIRLQLAYLAAERENWAEAERSLRNMTAEYANEPEVWKALISVLHEQGRSQEARAEADRIPATVITRLYNDPGYVGVMASVYNALGDYTEGLRMVRDAIAIYQMEQEEVPADLQIQLGWLLLNADKGKQQTYSMLQQVSARDDLSDKQRAEVDELWIVWSLRESKAAVDTGDFDRATAILSAALRLYPEDVRLYAALAGAYLDADDQAQALVVYRNWGLEGATAEDYSGAIGSAMTMKDGRSVSRWLRQGLAKWPSNPTLLTLAGQEAASRGDYARAEQYWQLALEAMPAGAPLPQQLGGAQLNQEQQDLARLLVAGVVDPTDEEPYVVLGNAVTGEGGATTPPYSSAQKRSGMTPPATLSEALDPVTHRGVRDPYGRAVPNRVNRSNNEPYMAHKAERTPLPSLPFDRRPNYQPTVNTQHDTREALEEQIAQLHARNSPFAGVHPMLRSRTGRDGFETLSEQQLNFEAATVFRDKFRVAVIARPTYLDAGNPDGNTDLRLGLAPSGADLGSNTASGIGGEVQLSSESFGLKAGVTPDGFLVRNATLGVRIRPANGPFTLMFDRDVVKDTMLSYAGVRDPISGQVFGGVMANALSLQGDWGVSDSGVYVRAGYQHITGEHVQNNRRIEGGGGAWWRVMQTIDGSLTLGANLFGMKYDKNLRYFTLGHGGYFSPQRYILFNIPVTWEGVYDGRFEYSISGSLGIQHISEDDAPYFPLDAALQGRSGPVYEGLTQTGEHFSLRLEGGYRVAPHWTIGGFVDVNNTRSFTNQAAGFYLRYVVREQPLVRDMSVPSLPDWTGGRQLGLP